VLRRLCWFALVAGIALGGAGARAATVGVQVADRAGKSRRAIASSARR
jgi:hypothetical protein